MTPRDYLEIGWHGGLLIFVVRPVLDYLRSRLWIRVLLGVAIALAIVYHVAVVQACYHHQPLCYWGNP